METFIKDGKECIKQSPISRNYRSFDLIRFLRMYRKDKRPIIELLREYNEIHPEQTLHQQGKNFAQIMGELLDEHFKQ